jgi:hypothetical protein
VIIRRGNKGLKEMICFEKKFWAGFIAENKGKKDQIRQL